MKTITRNIGWWVLAEILNYRSEPFANSTKSFTGYPGRPTDFGRLPMEWHDKAASPTIDYTIYSYATPIAWRDNGEWIIPDVKYSVTTSRHQSQVRVAAANPR